MQTKNRMTANSEFNLSNSFYKFDDFNFEKYIC